VRFWDTSALVPLFVAEAASPRVRDWLADDPDVTVWTLSLVELLSALARRRRATALAAGRVRQARREALAAWERWSEVTAVDLVRRHAERLVEAHPLPAADALQIGAALVVAGGDPPALEFVTLDDQQAQAAEREGLQVLGPR
jgi:predicted nucleic acid-binding protein